MTDMQNTDKKLNILKDLVRIADEVENSIQGDFKDRSMLKISDEELDDYFVYQFLLKTKSYARSVILLAEHQFSKEVVLIARTILEGWFYFKSFINVKLRATGKPLSKKWRDFWIYQFFQNIRQQDGEVKAIELLTELENTMGVSVVTEAIREFDPYNDRLVWYKRGNLNALIEVDGDKTLMSFYRDVYSLYSQIQHWNPFMMTSKLDPELELGLIAVIFSVFNIAEYANIEYNLKFDDELANIKGRAIELQISQMRSL